ncbi:pre-B-cell leukemia homeobox interacting protein 1b [Thalassophryne amazonica]|uniref:pre-B-cell leukemia homeobox interacting protein 1b n=1 Tax=Thalassophryne amazonica TaxID=390379 RepID=UPI00147232FE|nr:pre-B-cell leukemia homeobox interacting protein 1b [Thalassophryne amazonica]
MTEQHEESHTGCEGNSRLGESVVSDADGLSVEDSLVSEERAKLNGDESTDHQPFVPTSVVNSSMPSSLEASGSVILSSESEGLSEGLALPTSDTDAFAETYTHISPSHNEPPASVLSTETLGRMEPVQESALYPLNEEPHQEQMESVLSPRMTDFDNQTGLVEEEKTEKTQEDEEPALRRRRSLLATLEQIGRGEEEGEQDFQLPRREEDSVFSVNKCILGAIILLGLGTIFLSGVFMVLDEERDYGLGEMNDSEVPGKVPTGAPVEPDRTELLNMLAKGDQQLALLQTQLQAQEEELKVVKGQAAEGVAEQLHWAEVEQENSRLKEAVASLLALQEENERLKRQMESFPALQKELELLRSVGAELKPSSANEAASAFVKQTSLPPSGQSEDHRHGTAGKLERDSKKPQHEQREGEMEKYDLGEKTEWKRRQKPEWKGGEKKDLKHGSRTEEKDERKSRKHKEKQKKYSEEIKQRKDSEWKKEKVSRGDEGKPWKEMGEKNGWNEDEDRKRGKQWRDEEERDRKGAKDRKEEWGRKRMKQGFEESGSERKHNGEKREWKDDKNWKGAKQWRDEEERDWKEAKDHREEWKERKKVKGDFQKSGDEKDEVQKDKGERKEWKKAGDWKNKNTRDVKEKGERKRWSENEWKGGSKDFDEEWRDEKRWHNGESKNAKRWKTQDGSNRKSEDGDEGDERTLGKRAWSEMKRAASKDTSSSAEWKKDKKNSEKCEDECGYNENQEHLWRHGKPPPVHCRPSLDQPEYWMWQRARLQHSPRRSTGCDTLETCAQAEGLLPVPSDQFETLLQEYLAKAEEAGVEASKREMLQKLSAEFFTDGVFVHDQISFQDFVEDLEDILEDMVEEEESDAGGDSAITEDADGFEQEAMKRFLAEGARRSEESIERGRRASEAKVKDFDWSL